MRVLVRPLVFFALLVTFTATVQSQEQAQPLDQETNPGVNLLLFAAGSPTPISSGVTVGLTIQPTTTYTCTSVTISVVDQNAKTLAAVTIQNPGATVNQTFNGLGSGVNVDIVVNSVFQSGAQFDFPYIESNVTTK